MQFRPVRRWIAPTRATIAFAATALAMTFLVSCARPVVQTAAPLDRLQVALSPASFAGSLNLQQQVHVERDGRNVDFDAVLEISPDVVTLVGLGFGTRLFTLRYDGTSLNETRSPMLPKDVQGRDILSDMQLALWPVDAVRAALPAGYTLRDEGAQRVLSRGAEEILVITYDSTPRWTGTMTLQNRPFAYRLVIRTAPEPR